MIVTPAARAASTSATVFGSIPVLSITADTAPCSTPPSEVNSFWYSISTSAVLAGSSCKVSAWLPPVVRITPRSKQALVRPQRKPSCRHAGSGVPRLGRMDLRHDPMRSPRPAARALAPARRRRARRCPAGSRNASSTSGSSWSADRSTAQDATGVAAALLTLDAAGPAPVQLHVASAGGELVAAHAIIDVIDAMTAPVHAVVTSEAGGAVLAVLAAAEQRSAYRHARFKLAEPRAAGVTGTADEVAAAAGQHLRELEEMVLRLVEVTGQTRSRIEDDLSAGRVLSAAEACEYGLIDEIVGRRETRALLRGGPASRQIRDLLGDLHTHRAGGAGDDLDRGVDVVGVEVGQLALGDRRAPALRSACRPSGSAGWTRPTGCPGPCGSGSWSAASCRSACGCGPRRRVTTTGMISPRFFDVASSYSTLTARMLAPVGPSILPRSTIAALPASSARVTSWVFFLGGIASGLP